MKPVNSAAHFLFDALPIPNINMRENSQWFYSSLHNSHDQSKSNETKKNNEDIDE